MDIGRQTHNVQVQIVNLIVVSDQQIFLQEISLFKHF